jgi:hypothetical protein
MMPQALCRCNRNCASLKCSSGLNIILSGFSFAAVPDGAADETEAVNGQ